MFRNKKLSRVLCGMLVMVLCLSFAGCGGDGTTPSKHKIKAGETADVNPLKGFYAFSGEEVDFPVSLEWFYIPVNAVNLDEGVYDWSALEYRLNEVASRGRQAVLRFYYDYPGEESGIPQYLIDDGLLLRSYDEPDDLGGGGLCPDYSDENFRKSMQEFVAEFGKNYDGDVRIAYITEGLLGFWGEWHNWPFDIDLSDQKPDWTIPAEVYTEIYEAFDAAFDQTRLLVREPKEGVDNAKYDTGYHDDSFAFATLSYENGGQEWSYMSKVKNLGMEDVWEYAPIGGEVYPPLQAEYFLEEYYGVEPNPDTDPSADMVSRQDWYECLEESHATFMLCNAIINYTDKTRENAIEAAKALGYDLQVTNAYYCNTLEAGTPLSLKVDIKNNGVAPFYYDHTNWPVLIGVKQNGTLVKQYYTEWDICDVKADGKEVSFEHVVDAHGLGGGEYTLCIKVQNPLYGGVNFSFANEGMTEDGWLELGGFDVKGEAVTYAPVESDVKPLELNPPQVVADGENGQWQAENGTLEGIATLTDTEKAVGGLIAGWIGTGTEGTGSVTMTVEAPEAGFYNVDVGYVLGESFRNGKFDVNGGAANGGDTVTYKFNSTGGWAILGNRSIVLFLNEGTNTIKYYNDEGWAASIDCLTLTKGSTNGIQNIDGDLSDWGETEVVYADGANSVKVNKDDSYLYFAVEGTSDWKINLATSATSINYTISPDGVYGLNDNAEFEKKVEANADSSLIIAQNGNVAEIMVRRDVFETSRASLGYDLGVSLGEDTEFVIYELKYNPRRIDVTRRFPGSEFRNWSNTEGIYSDEFQNIYITADADYLYFACEHKEGTPEYADWSVELNVDSSSNTGYVMDWLWYWESTGNDYKICDGGLYRYNVDGTTELISDGSDDVVGYNYVDGTLEVKVKKAALDMGNRKTLCYGMIFTNEGAKWNESLVTNSGARMLNYQLGAIEEPRFGAETTLFDGWGDVDTAEIAGKHILWTHDDGEYLYLATEYDYDNIAYWQVMIDADNKANTGMQSDWPFAPGGADYIIEAPTAADCVAADIAYQEVSDGNWTFGKKISDAVTCIVDPENKRIEVKILKSAISNEERPLANVINYGIRFVDEAYEAVGATNSSDFFAYEMKAE